MIKHWIVPFLLILGVIYASGKKFSTSQPDTCDEAPKTNTGRLKKNLFCGYDSSVRPVAHHSNQTSVKMAAFPSGIHWMAEERNTLWMTFWFFMQWKDDLLTWNSSHYDGLEEFHADGNKIWFPKIFVRDSHQADFSSQSCVVSYNGSVECSMSVAVLTRCHIDFTYFPNDRHQCKVAFRPRSYKNSALDLDFMKVLGDPFKFYHSHGIWNLVSMNKNRNVTKLFDDIYTTDLEYTFVIERRSSAYYTVTPLTVMMMMVLSVFWLEPHCSARIILPVLTILCHMIVLEWLMQIFNSYLAKLPAIIEDVGRRRRVISCCTSGRHGAAVAHPPYPWRPNILRHLSTPIHVFFHVSHTIKYQKPK